MGEAVGEGANGRVHLVARGEPILDRAKPFAQSRVDGMNGLFGCEARKLLAKALHLVGQAIGERARAVAGAHFGHDPVFEIDPALFDGPNLVFARQAGKRVAQAPELGMKLALGLMSLIVAVRLRLFEALPTASRLSSRAVAATSWRMSSNSSRMSAITLRSTPVFAIFSRPSWTRPISSSIRSTLALSAIVSRRSAKARRMSSTCPATPEAKSRPSSSRSRINSARNSSTDELLG